MSDIIWTPAEMDALRQVLAENDARIAELERMLADLRFESDDNKHCTNLVNAWWQRQEEGGE